VREPFIERTVVSGRATSTPPVPANVTAPPAVVLPKVKSSAVSFTELFITTAFLIFPVRLYRNEALELSRLIEPEASTVSFDIDAANDDGADQLERREFIT